MLSDDQQISSPLHIKDNIRYYPTGLDKLSFEIAEKYKRVISESSCIHLSITSGCD